MANKLQATQISIDTNSWYQKLRRIQSKTHKIAHNATTMTQTTDPNVRAGSVATATTLNNFLTALNSLSSNEFFQYADWSSVPATASGHRISSTLKTEIDDVLDELSHICSNYSTNDECYNCSDYTTEAVCTDNAVDSYTGCYTINYAEQTNSTCNYQSANGTYSQNGTWAETVSDATIAYSQSYDTVIGTTDSTYSESPYATENAGYQQYNYHESYGVNNTERANAACHNNATYSQGHGVCSQEFAHNATAEYNRSADPCGNCSFWNNGDSTVWYGTCNEYDYVEVCYTCAKHGIAGDATNSVSLSNSTYQTYSVTDNSVYTN